jgi:DNA mismatch endonuclease (patch repair protein)
MASVKSSGNKSTEAVLATMLRKEHLSGWRRNYPLVGKPDFVFPVLRLAIFVDGCFWHGCPKHCRMPAANRKYWEQKINRNVKRGREVCKLLRSNGWRVIRFWEHDLRGDGGLLGKMRNVKKIVQQDKSSVCGKPRRC